MSWTSFQTETSHVARKPHRCAFCKSTIPVGVRHLKLAGKWDGDFYSKRGHTDCRALWTALYDDWCDSYGEGMAFDLCEVFSETGEIKATQSALDGLRGFYPHAVNRIEFRLQDWLSWDEVAA